MIISLSSCGREESGSFNLFDLEPIEVSGIEDAIQLADHHSVYLLQPEGPYRIRSGMSTEFPVVITEMGLFEIKERVMEYEPFNPAVFPAEFPKDMNQYGYCLCSVNFVVAVVLYTGEHAQTIGTILIDEMHDSLLFETHDGTVYPYRFSAGHDEHFQMRPYVEALYKRTTHSYRWPSHLSSR